MTHILVVDDQPDIRELLKTILELRGFEVEQAVGGIEALQRIANPDDFDLILLDVQMPQMDGWDTLSSIRDRFGELGPRVVLCTVKGHPRDLIHGWMLGCDGYVWKPFDLNAIVHEVNAVIERSTVDRTRTRRNAIAEAETMLRAVT
jgi:DNA-binding response OmpR family regulator